VGFSLAPAGRIIHHDQDPVFTSYARTHCLLIEDRCRISYALEGARDNPRMEGFFDRFCGARPLTTQGGR
jgi:hypothetical protein